MPRSSLTNEFRVEEDSNFEDLDSIISQKSIFDMEKDKNDDDVITPTPQIELLPHSLSFNIERNSSIQYPDVRRTDALDKLATSKPFLVSGQVLICCLSSKFPPNIAYFIAPFRHKSDAPIVILSIEKPDEDEWTQLESYGNIHSVLGTPLLRKDLVRANVQLATHCVVIAVNF